ncbi:hypothetical protein DXG03_002377 [Asterophora parasitica]|uniref:Uncharacterized protein n=1 Tax=Asterophora parasitica TaxID=117018 RepID=A0A9P7FZB6_9AGAR|nr:hypothetical protein DXG03_002377 [Asterophora parasitica]
MLVPRAVMRGLRCINPDGISDKDIVTDITNATDGRAYLEKHLLLVPSNFPTTTKQMAAALFQVAAISGIGHPVVNMIMALAYILEDMEKDDIKEGFQETMDVKLQETVGIVKEMTRVVAKKVDERVKALVMRVDKMGQKMQDAVEKILVKMGTQ